MRKNGVTHLYLRMVKAYLLVEPIKCDWCIIWENPSSSSEPACITYPSQRYLAFLMHGGICPPISSWLSGDRDRINYDKPMGKLPLDQALKYVLMKDVPRHVWQNSANRPYYKIVPTSLIPSVRDKRNAWSFNPDLGVVTIDKEKLAHHYGQ